MECTGSTAWNPVLMLFVPDRLESSLPGGKKSDLGAITDSEAYVKTGALLETHHHAKQGQIIGQEPFLFPSSHLS